MFSFFLMLQGQTVDDLVESMTGMMIQHRMGRPDEVRLHFPG